MVEEIDYGYFKDKGIILCFLFVFLLTACGKSDIKHPYEQEYAAGQGNIKGNVNTEDFYARDKRLSIGATKDGYAVFKDPEDAYDALLENYSDGLKLIQDEYNLEDVSSDNYQEYKTYGWQVTTGTAAAQEQAHFISSFFDIYENSYE